MRLARRSTIAALSLALPLSLAACGNSGSDTAASSSSSMPSSSSSSSSSSSTTTSDMAAKPFGAGCSAVPADGKGSFSGMATDPVATAASNNPVLSTLVTAVTKAGLGETLNSAKDITVFAPSNDAFAALPKATLDAALKDPKGLLTKVLTNHVVPGKLTPEMLAGTHKTLGGGSITVTGSGDSFMVGKAKVICGNVQTANATVYIIDGVLLPG
ncbi:putative surface protein with fasciclin (FAS1) repeats [Phycicoccus badiiscoriae]|uniref:Putative surface protein with fasciclin (FAS1) repeats n=1 Tax=Pedococcus badiiscoriae TaxID=642776 RepID=A0A852WLJ3_9MICO|nr:fasciclin domain-containing protein [Pedococcus badiiscoriae]NYG07075.1 putative surface protein with fasciclin (FAS1) repeats [Pedococcus badiiscoriae]